MEISFHHLRGENHTSKNFIPLISVFICLPSNIGPLLNIKEVGLPKFLESGSEWKMEQVNDGELLL